ncbi:MAG: hypothetical protein GKR88_12950 [Flavobacteriaceae bacterium]|nr:MAG: hypothetical protein GKR88_12950 [Flavobacteriaceae bacterium]
MGDKNSDLLKWHRDKKVIYPLTIGLFVGVLISIIFLSSDCNPDSQEYDKFLCYLSKNKTLTILYWGLLMAFLTNLLTGKKIRMINIPKYNSKSRIAILIPVSCSEYYESEDLKLMLEGFGEGISDFAFKTNYKLSESYEIVLIDSKNFELALKKVKEEIEFGTKYFISTLSSFSTDLSDEFLKLSDEAILINTISGTTAIKEVKNRIYNFYPTSISEVDAIIDCIESRNLENPFIYNFNSKYTRECRDYFIEKWNEIKSKDKHISKKENSYEFINQSSFDLSHPKFINDKVHNSGVLLIFGYGNSFYDLLDVLKPKVTDINSKYIYTISTFKYRSWKVKEEDTLNGLKTITVRPKMQDSKFYTEKDVVKYFSEQTLDRFLKSLELINAQNLLFDNAWNETSPNRLEYDISGKVKVETIEL